MASGISTGRLTNQVLEMYKFTNEQQSVYYYQMLD